MKRLLVFILGGAFLAWLGTVLILWIDVQMPLGDALFMAVGLTFQGEPVFGLEPEQLRAFDKIVIALCMISGMFLTAIIFGFVTDRVLALRLDYLLGKRGIPTMHDHIILIGLGHIGFRTWEAVKRLDPQTRVIAIEKDTDNPNIEEVRRHGDHVIVEDPRHSNIFERAHLATARTIICCTDDDLANLDFALTAREAKPDIRIVMRMYDQRLAKRIQAGFDIHVALSSSSLAAPAFAAAAFDRSIINSYYLGHFQVVTAKVNVKPDSKLIGVTTRAMERDFNCALLKRISTAGESTLYPKDEYEISAGDTLLVSCTYPDLRRLKEFASDDFS